MDKPDIGDRYPQWVARRAGPVITGRFVRFGESYTREIKVGQPLLVAVLVAAGAARAVLLLVLSVLRGGAGTGAARRRFKDLKKGPEFVVTPTRIRDHLDQLYDVELHGHLPQSALHPGDLVQVTVRPQKDAALPVRIERMVNLTTMQPLSPRLPTIWSHLGPALLLQAGVGLLLLAWLAVAVLGR